MIFVNSVPFFVTFCPKIRSLILELISSRTANQLTHKIENLEYKGGKCHKQRVETATYVKGISANKQVEANKGRKAIGNGITSFSNQETQLGH